MQIGPFGLRLQGMSNLVSGDAIGVSAQPKENCDRERALPDHLHPVGSSHLFRSASRSDDYGTTSTHLWPRKDYIFWSALYPLPTIEAPAVLVPMQRAQPARSTCMPPRCICAKTEETGSSTSLYKRHRSASISVLQGLRQPVNQFRIVATGSRKEIPG